MRYVAMSAALLALALSTPAVPQIPPTYVKHSAVKQVICDNGLGSAFRVGPTTFATAAHVADNAGCEIEDQPITVEQIDQATDYALVSVPVAPKGLVMDLDCSGFTDKQFYYAIGYAGGFPKQRHLVVRFSQTVTNLARAFVKGLSALVGPVYFIRGMSGGPVTNSEGRATGIVNAFDPFLGLSFSRPLSETPLCR